MRSPGGRSAEKAPKQADREFVVLMRPDRGAFKPGELIAAAARRDPAFLARFGNPAAVRKLLYREPTPWEAYLEGVSPLAPTSILHRYAVMVYDSTSERDARLAALKSDPDVLSVEPNLEIKPSVDPNDPMLGTADVLNTGDTTNQWGMWRMNFPATWESRTKGNAYVAVIDFGINATRAQSGPRRITGSHPDHPRAAPFAQGNWREHFSGSFIRTDLPNAAVPVQIALGDTVEELSPPDDANTPLNEALAYGHGTHVAGIVAAATNNSLGVSGGCPTCSLISVNDTGRLAAAQLQDMATALVYAVDSGAQVVNLSREIARSPTNASLCLPATQTAEQAYGLICTVLDIARQRGVAVVAVAGNGSMDLAAPFDPVSNPIGRVSWLGRLKEYDVITVGAVDFDGFRLNRPDLGLVSGAGPALDVMAPGVNIISTFPPGSQYNSGIPCVSGTPAGAGSSYGWCTGTSMSTPHVSAAVALAMSANPLVGGSGVRQLVMQSGDRPTRTDDYGYGVPNVLTLVDKAIGIANATNRRTPLFAFYSVSMADHFYTVFPQMGAAALNGTLPPVRRTNDSVDPTVRPPEHNLPPADYTTRVYSSEGTMLLDFAYFPGTCADPTRNCNPDQSRRPMAIAEVLTTPQPFGGFGTSPLYRYSRFQSNDNFIKHIYSAESERNTLLQQGWTLDGIEGYIHPAGAQPGNTWTLCRGYNSQRNDWALSAFNGSCPPSFSLGDANYGSVALLGYVYPTTDPATDIDGDGVSDLVEAVQGSNMFVKDNDIFTHAWPFVWQQFRDFYMREGLPNEVNNSAYSIYVGASTRKAYVETLVRSPEHADLAGPVTRLYSAYFLRYPDIGGLQFWMQQYKNRPASGWSFEGISEYFSLSPEFQQRYGALSNAQFVTLIYQNVLNREPEPGGFAFWLDELNSGRRIRGNVMAAFSESPENKAKKKGEVEVVSLYASMLKSPPDPAKMGQYANFIRDGGSSQDLIQHILDLPAYRARFLP